MKKLIFLLLLCLSTAFAVDYDTTQVYIYTVSVQKNGTMQHYSTAAGSPNNADQQISIIFTQLEADAISHDSITVFWNTLEFITADGVLDTMYSIITDIQNMNPVADTLSESWFDNDSWRTVYEGLTPYYIPAE